MDDSWQALSPEARVQWLAERLTLHPFEKGGATISTISNASDGRTVLGRSDGSLQSVGRFGDHSLTLFTDDRDRPIGYAVVSSDAACDLDLPIHNPSLEAMGAGIRAYDRLDDLVDVGFDVARMTPADLWSDEVAAARARLAEYGVADYAESKRVDAWAEGRRNGGLAVATAGPIVGLDDAQLVTLMPGLRHAAIPGEDGKSDDSTSASRIDRVIHVSSHLAGRRVDPSAPTFAPSALGEEEARREFRDVRYGGGAREEDVAVAALYAARLDDRQLRLLMPNIAADAAIPPQGEAASSVRAHAVIQAIVHARDAVPARVASKGAEVAADAPVVGRGRDGR